MLLIFFGYKSHWKKIEIHKLARNKVLTQKKPGLIIKYSIRTKEDEKMTFRKAFLYLPTTIALLLSACNPTNLIQPEPAIIPSPPPNEVELSPTPRPTITPFPTRTPLSGCPGSPYTIGYTDYKYPADIDARLSSLIQDLTSPDPVASAAAATWIPEYGEEAVFAIPYLVSISGDETALQYQSGFPTTPGTEAIKAIAQIGGNCAVMAFRIILENGEAITRDHAAQYLGDTVDPGAIELLYELLKDEEWIVRDNALYSLGTLIYNQVYDQNTLDVLIGIATNEEEDLDIRTHSIKVIGLFAQTQASEKDNAINLLLEFADDENSRIRENTAIALEKINTPEVIKTLIFMLKDQDPLVVIYTSESLKNLTGQDFGQDYKTWNEWWNSKGQETSGGG